MKRGELLDEDSTPVDAIEERYTLQPKTYYQNYHFKPVDLGDYDHLPLPMISQRAILERLSTEIIRFTRRSFGLQSSRIIPLLEDLSEKNHYELFCILIRNLLSKHRPDLANSEIIHHLTHTKQLNLHQAWIQYFIQTDEEKLTFKKVINQERTDVCTVQSFLMLLDDLNQYETGMDKALGNLTPRMQQMLKQLNKGIDRGEGLGMFHHGCDSANPFSTASDMCPATGVLPFPISSYGQSVMVMVPEKMLQMVRTLKGYGFYVHTNPQWQQERAMRSRRFEWALECLIGGASVEDDPLREALEINLSEMNFPPEFTEKMTHCLPPYLYDYFIQNSEDYTSKRNDPEPPLPIEAGKIKIHVKYTVNPANDIAN